MEQINADNEPSELSDLAFGQVREYLKGNRHDFDFPYELDGTDFQKKCGMHFAGYPMERLAPTNRLPWWSEIRKRVVQLAWQTTKIL